MFFNSLSMYNKRVYADQSLPYFLLFIYHCRPSMIALIYALSINMNSLILEMHKCFKRVVYIFLSVLHLMNATNISMGCVHSNSKIVHGREKQEYRESCQREDCKCIGKLASEAAVTLATQFNIWQSSEQAKCWSGKYAKPQQKEKKHTWENKNW